jgi:hypothetical protein
MNQDVFCPKCGRPRQTASVCSCGHLYDSGRVAVSGNKILGTSPMTLPDRCVKCGKDASRGRRVDRTLYGYSQWLVLTVLLGLIVFIVLYYATRQALRLSYATCPDCTRSRDVKRRVSWGGWALFVVLLVTAIAFSSSVLGIMSAVAFIGAVVASVLAASPLRVAGFDGNLFTVKGAGKEFLAALGGPRTY